MIRRARDRVRHDPDWNGSPFREGSLAAPLERVHPPHRLRRRLSTVAAVSGALGFLIWLVFKSPGEVGEVGIRPVAKSHDVQVVEAVPPAPEQETRLDPEFVPPERQIPTTHPMVPQPPSVGLVEQGEAGGSGNGIPGLDLGLEGGAGGLAVAGGGGGRGGGAGTGVGSGVGSQRFVYQLGQVDEDAQVEKIFDPPYPRRAKEDGIEAAVELRLLVDERGRVEKIEVLGAPPGYGFDAALKAASQQWKFKPAHLGGVPVPQWVRMPYSFHLE